MEKKIFEAPEVIVTVFEESDILTLSTSESSQIPTSDWTKW